MTLRLILTRHAKSDWSQAGQDDFDRSLNHRGRRDAPRLGEWLASRHYLPDLVLCSPAIRTRETMDFTLAALAAALDPSPAEPEIRYRAPLYQADPETMLAELRAASGAVVLMIGHNPGIAALARSLVHDQPAHPRFADFPTLATAVIDFTEDDWAQVGPGRGALRDFIVPDDWE